MSRYYFAAAPGLQWLVLVGGVVLLTVYRRRAPRAIGFALPLVALTALFAAWMPFLILSRVRVPVLLLHSIYWSRDAIEIVFCTLLPVIAMSGRRGGVGDGR